MFVQKSKIVILLENGHQHDAEEEKENILQEFSKNSCFVGLFIKSWAIGTDFCH
jgi:hypothetical protein